MKILETIDTGTCTKTLKIEVPTEDIDQERDDVYKEFLDQAIVPGFRKGKAPRHILKMRFGKHIDQEAVNKAVETAFKKAVEELDLKPAGQPEIGEIEDAKGDAPIVFEAKLEYVPKIEIAAYDDIKPEPPASEVSEKDVEETLQNLRTQNAVYAGVEDRPVSDGDLVTISSAATIDGAPFPEATQDEIPIQIGSGRYIPGLEDQLIGMEIGQEKSFTLTLPENYPHEEQRGKEASFEVKVKQVQEQRLPELDDEFAKDLGDFQNLDELKERIRKNLEENLEQSRRTAIVNSVREELLKRNSFDVPPSMVKARYEYINALQDSRLRQYGRSLEGLAQEDQGLLTRNEQQALAEVRLSIILTKIAEKEDIQIEDEEYRQYLSRIAMENGADPNYFIQRVEQQGIDSYYKQNALEEKTLRTLVVRAFPEESGT